MQLSSLSPILLLATAAIAQQTQPTLGTASTIGTTTPPACQVISNGSEQSTLHSLDSASPEATNTQVQQILQQRARLSPLPLLTCVHGPHLIIHTVPNTFFYPPIYKKSCDNLFCKDPPCISAATVWKSRCVLVFRLINGVWVKVGFQIIRYLEHLSCRCKECRDIKTHWECITQKPCPNSIIRDSFCYWTPQINHGKRDTLENKQVTREDIFERDGEREKRAATFAPTLVPPPGFCDCCIPRICVPPHIVFNKLKCRCECPATTCPPGQVLNLATCKCECPRIRCPPGQYQDPVTCKCVCPPGSYFDTNIGRCVGRCSQINLKRCSDVLCKDNLHFKCKQVNNKCKCPSCDDVKHLDSVTCLKTKCMEQPSMFKCKYEDGQCRCPKCEDQTEVEWCEKTICGTNFETECKWNLSTYPRCKCPTSH